MNTAVCAAIKEQEDVAARRWRRRVSPRTAGLRRAAAGAGRNRAAAYLSSAITTASNMSCSTATAAARLSSGPRTPAIPCSSRHPSRCDHKRPAYQPEETTSVYAARSTAGKDGKRKKPKKKSLLRMGRCAVDGGWSKRRPAPPLLCGWGGSCLAGIVRCAERGGPGERCFYFQNPNRWDRI